jgi:hypothetical protein
MKHLPNLLRKTPLAGGLAGARLTCARARILICALACLLFGSGTAAAQIATTTTLAVTSSRNPVTTVATGTVVTLTGTVTAASTPVTPGIVNFCDATAARCEGIHIVSTAQLISAAYRPGLVHR